MRHRTPFVRLGQEIFPDTPPGPWRVPGVPGARLSGSYRAPFLVELNSSGERGAPLTSDRLLKVRPSETFDPSKLTAPPATDLTRIWPFLFAPEDSYPITRVGPAGGTQTLNVGQTLNILTINEVPRGWMGVVKKFGQTSNDFINVAWTFLIKGRPVDPITAIQFQFGALNLPTDLPGPGVIVRPGDDFAVQVTNVGIAQITGIRARVDLYWWQIRS